MRVLLYLSCLLLFGVNPVLAQSDSCHFSVKGKVLDAESKKPIPYVSVQIKGLNRTTHTDEAGNFLIDKLCDEINTIVITCLGYCDSICDHPHHHEETPHIYLTQKVEQLETVLIEAEKGPEQGTKAIAQITLKKADLQNDLTQSLASSIADEEGVNLVSKGANVQLPVIHGLYGNRILILNNGLKHGFQNWGGSHAPEIDPSSINNITIVKGAAGVRFGPEAIGGAIIVESNHMHYKEPYTVDYGAGYQSNGKGYYSNLEISNGFKNWSYFINGHFGKIGDRHAPDYMLTNSGKMERSFSAGTRYKLKQFDFKILHSYVDQELAILRSSIAESANSIIESFNAEEPRIINPFSYDIGAPNHQTQHQLTKFETNWWYADESFLTFRFGRQHNKRQEYDVRRDSERPIIDLDLYTSDYQLEWHHPHWLKLEGLMGFQYFYQGNYNNAGTGTTPLIPNYKSNRLSAFLIESKELRKSSIEAGIRVDYETNSVIGRETNQDLFNDEFSFTNATASLGLVKRFNSYNTLRSNLGSSWRTPNMLELYSFGQHGFQTSFGLLRYYTNDNGDLKTNRVLSMSEAGVSPERGYKFTNELESIKEKDKFVITAYAQFIENFIFDKPLALIGTVRGPMPVFIYDQVDAAFVGADFTWKREWNKKLSGKFGSSYLWSRDVENNASLINQIPIRFSYGLKWNYNKIWKLTNVSIGLKPSYTLQQLQAPRTVTPEELIAGDYEITPDSEIFDFMDVPEAYFLLEASLKAEFNDFTASIRVRNLLNNSYRDNLNSMRYFADEPGRNILFSINYKFKKKEKVHKHDHNH